MKYIITILMFFVFITACKENNNLKSKNNKTKYGLLTKTARLYKDIGTTNKVIGACAKGTVVTIKKKDMQNKHMWYEIACEKKQGWFQLVESKELVISSSADFLKGNKEKYLKEFK